MNKSKLLQSINKRLRSEQGKKKVLDIGTKTPFQWRPFLALVAMYMAFLFDWQWAWGILFLYWVIPDLFRGVTYFIEPVEKENSPFLYWTIIISWILMSLVSLATLFIEFT